VNAAIENLRIGGNTNFLAAMTKAIELVEKSLLNPAVLESSIIFITDGQDTSGYDPNGDIAKLEALGTKVFTFAIGTGSTCSSALEQLASETGAGACELLAEPSALERVIEQIFIATRNIDSVRGKIAWKLECQYECILTNSHILFTRQP